MKRLTAPRSLGLLLLAFLLTPAALSSKMPKRATQVQFEYFAFPDILFVGSERQIAVCLVNHGRDGELIYDGAGNGDQVVVSIPVGTESDDLTNEPVLLGCSSERPDWHCLGPELVGEEAYLTLRPVGGAVPVARGETLCFQIDTLNVNAETGLAILGVDQQIGWRRAKRPRNSRIAVFKTDIQALAHDDLAEVRPDQHHEKTTSFAELTDQATDAQIPDAITVNYAAAASTAGTATNACMVDGMHADQLTTDQWVNEAGDTMTGPLTLPGPPVEPSHAATKAYVDEDIGLGLWGTYCESVMESCSGPPSSLLDCPPAVPEPTATKLAEKFAPQLRFDQAASTFPSSPEWYYQEVIKTGRLYEQFIGMFFTNYDPATLKDPRAESYGGLESKKVPTYYRVFRCGKQVRIVYWWYYGHQPDCAPFGGGSHDADWEHIMIILSEAEPDKLETEALLLTVTFYQHAGWYTRRACERYGTPPNHPVVYVGKVGHGSYYDQGGGGASVCCYFRDYRNNKGRQDLWLNTWEYLVDIDKMGEEWMTYDATHDFYWGGDAVNTHPTRDTDKGNCCANLCRGQDPSCDLTGDNTQGCHVTMCLGDDELEHLYFEDHLSSWRICRRPDGSYYNPEHTRIPTGDEGISKD